MSGHDRMQNLAERTTKFIEDVVVFAEVIMAVVMAILVVLGVVYLVDKLWLSLMEGHILGGAKIITILDIALIVFLIIELFRITLAYITNQRVMPTVIEAAFVAVGRKIVLYEYSAYGINGALALAALLAVITVAHFLYAREGRIKTSDGLKHGKEEEVKAAD